MLPRTGRAAALALVTVLLAAGGSAAQVSEANFREKALALNNVTGDTAIAGKVRELRKDKDALKKLLAEAKAVAKEKEKQSPFNYTAGLILARSATAVKDYDTGEFFYKLCLEHAFKNDSTRKKAQVFTGLIDLFDRAKEFDKEYFTCEKFLDLKGEEGDDEIMRGKIGARERQVMILSRQKKFDKALKLCDEAIEETDNGAYFKLRKASVLRDAGRPQDSASAYQEVIDEIEKNEDLKEETRKTFVELCRYYLSNVYVDLNQIDKSIEILEELSKAHPDNSTYLNDLGFVLADHDRRLDDAEKMVEKALDIDRGERKKLAAEGSLEPDDNEDNPAYVDSLAWVFFKKKNYPKALELMQEVVKSEDAQHPEIYDHLGDVYKALGRTDEAEKAWRKALTLDDVSPRDAARKDAIRKKVEAGK